LMQVCKLRIIVFIAAYILTWTFLLGLEPGTSCLKL
jgi:hypothetical protein